MASITTTSSASAFRMQTAVSAQIAATPDVIMSLLASTQTWNSTVVSIEGEIRQGNIVRLISALDPKRTFKLKITTATPTRLVWEDGFAPMFKGIRTFTLTPQPDGTTLFEMVEVFSGVMLPLIKSSLPNFIPNFEQYAHDLKTAAEKR